MSLREDIVQRLDGALESILEAVAGTPDYVDLAEHILEDEFPDALARVVLEYRAALVEDPPLCGQCSGSGEGPHQGTTCYTCKGKGVIPWRV